MKISVIQSTCAAINSVYIINDFIDNKDYLNLLSNKIEKYTEKDEMNRQTNVKASMTSYKKLLSDEDFNIIHVKILETMLNIYKLRTPHPFQEIVASYRDSWGMAHKKDDHTVNHVHLGSTFAGGFYFNVPCYTEMYFDDYQSSVQLKENMLLLFPGLCKHRVQKHNAYEKRISMAFNIDLVDT